METREVDELGEEQSDRRDPDAVVDTPVSRRSLLLACGGAVAGTFTLLGLSSGLTGAVLGLTGCAPASAPSFVGPKDAEAQSADEEPAKGSTFAYNTLVQITAYGVEQSVVNDCLAACAEFENLFSARRAGTDIDRVNTSAGKPVDVDPRTADLLREALEYCELSQGRFDVTIGSVSLLWDFMNAVKPSDEAIAEGLKHIDYTQVLVDGNTVTLADPDARIDLGGVAKGWICRELTRMLKDAGATGALVNLGTSSVYALGTKPDGSPWRIGLHNPVGDDFLGIVGIADISITSSGLYDQQFELDGVTYWHILDPATGYPAKTDMLGDTLICADPAMGDALSTMMFVMGSADAAEWIEREHEAISAMFVDEQGKTIYANGFEQYLVEVDSEGK